MKTVRATLVLATLIAWPVSSVAQVAAPQDLPPTQVEDVVVIGQDEQRTAMDFVATVAAPPEGREIAAWRTRICVGVVGMASEPARVLADRVSDWGYSLGLRVAPPGCRPNIVVVATSDGDAAARDLVTSRRREFLTGSAGTDRGRAALRTFQTSGKPVRWWHVSLPVNEDTGRTAVRLQGQAPVEMPRVTRSPWQLGWAGVSVLPSRFYDHTRDDLQQVIIVLESTALDQASFTQVADYVSMVALAQVDPEASPQTASILNLFDPDIVQQDTLSAWDQAYMRAVYGTQQWGAAPNVNASAIARATARQARMPPQSTSDPNPDRR